MRGDRDLDRERQPLSRREGRPPTRREGGYVLERAQRVPGTLAEVFPFFEDPHNLAEITPGWLRFRVLSSSDERVREGTRIRYRIRWLGLPMRWESSISRHDPPHAFADEMLRGPYKRWLHLHTFRQIGHEVELSDRVEYDLPGGLLGALAHRLIVRRQLEAIFDYRERRVRELLG